MGREGEKILFRRNEPKILLKTKWLASFGLQNELHFEDKNRQSKRKTWPKIDLCEALNETGKLENGR
jgi:hypothetical protein